MDTISKEDRDKAMDKIQKLLALAGENGLKQDNVNEGSSAMKKALELMEKYGLRFADFDKETGKSNVQQSRIPAADKRNGDWCGILINGISKIFNCRMVVTGDEYSIFGGSGDIDMLVWYYKFLKIKIARMGTPYNNNVKDKNNYCYGVTIKVLNRLKEMFEEAEALQTPETKALVLVASQDVEDAMNKAFPTLKQKTCRNINRNDILASRGYRDGDKVPLNKVIKN